MERNSIQSLLNAMLCVAWSRRYLSAAAISILVQLPAVAAPPPQPCRFIFLPSRSAFCAAVEIHNGFMAVVPSKTLVRPAELKSFQSALAQFGSIIARQRLYTYIFNRRTVSLTQSPTPPGVATVPADGSTQQFSVSLISKSGVTWKINPAIGSISDAGLYTAPKSIEQHQKITVTATSKDDPTMSATGILTLVPIPEWVRDLPGTDKPAASLAAALAQLKTWPDCKDCDHLLDTIAGMLIDPKDGDTPFVKAAFGGDAGDSFVSFQVEPLLNNVDDVQIGFDLGTPIFSKDGRLLTGAQARDWLARKYLHKFWIQSEIQQHFNSFYRDLGLNPIVIASSAADLPRSIHISESTRIGRIIFPNDKVNPDTKKIAYLLLDTETFSRYLDAKLYSLGTDSPLQGFVLCLPEVAMANRNNAQACDSQLHLPAGADQQRLLRYLDNMQLQGQQADLQSIGYAVTTTDEQLPDDGSADFRFRTPAIDLVVQKTAPASTTSVSNGTTAGDSTPKPASNQTDPTNRVSVGRQNPVNPQTTSSIGAEPSVTNQPIIPTSTGSVPAKSVAQYQYGGQIQYRPGQAVRVLGVLQSKDFHLGSLDGSATGQLGSDGAHAIGGGNLNLDFIWVRNHRATFHLTGSSDVTAQRILGRTITDERRTEGDAYAELELFRDLRGFRMGLTLEPQHGMVTLSPHGGSQAAFDLTTIQPGVMLAYSSSAALYPTSFHFAPSIKLGLGLASNEPTYQVFSVETGLHQRLSNTSLIALDLSGHFQLASASTPIFELPSLGGEDSVRGFRTDDAIGRTLWSLQSELWVPVPGTLNATSGEGVLGFLRQQIRLAGFFDIGGVTDTSLSGTTGAPLVMSQASEEGIRRGPGIGIRFLKSPIALKLDWAYGIGQGALGVGHGRFYVGVSTAAF